MRCAVIDNQTNIVTNIIIADADVDAAPEGFTLVNTNDAIVNIGYSYQNGQFLAPELPAVSATIPNSVTPRQVRLLLLSQGLLEQVEQMIAASDKATQITWEFATEFERDNPLLQALAANLNLTPEQVDQFFIAAAEL